MGLLRLIVVLILAAGSLDVYFSTPTRHQPNGWLHGTTGPWVNKPDAVFKGHDGLLFHRTLGARRGLYPPADLDDHVTSWYSYLDGDDEGIVNDILSFITCRGARMHAVRRPVYIQAKFMARHPHAIVCDAGVVTAIDGLTVTLLNGRRYTTVVDPKGCVTEGYGHSIGQYPHYEVIAQANRIVSDPTAFVDRFKELAGENTAYAAAITAILCVAYHFAPFVTVLALGIAAVYFAATALFYSAILLAIIASSYLCYKISTRVINQRADRCPIPVNPIKDRFKRLTNPIPAAAGGHARLAAWRRILEQECSHIFRDHGFNQYRDVGGSRSRRPEESDRKHICSAQNDNDDILRDDKSEQVFHNCRQPGQNCPERFNIRAAMLSHVDYHVTPDQLTEIITGPTFIINHRFGKPGVSGGYGAYVVPGEKKPTTHYEANWVNNGGQITMTTLDGTPYSHGYNQWQTEGTIVGPYKAASYVRVFANPDCDVYLAFPANGFYDRFAPGVLKRAPVTTQSLPNGTRYRLQTTYEGHLKTNIHYEDADGTEVPAHIPTTIAMGLCTSPRDDRFENLLNSLTIAELRKFSPSAVKHAPIVKSHARMLCDNFAIELVNNRSLKGFDPLSDGYLRCKAYQLVDSMWFLPRRVQQTCNDFLNSPVVLPVAKVLGVVHKVPAYEVFVDVMNAEIVSTRRKNNFRDVPPPVDASPDGGAKHSTAGEHDQRPGLDRDASDQPSLPPQPADHRPRQLDECSVTQRSATPPAQSADPDETDIAIDSLFGGGEVWATPQAGSSDDRSHGQLPDGTDPVAEESIPADHSGSPITNRFVDFRRCLELASSKGRQLFELRHPARGPNDDLRTVLSVDFSLFDHPEGILRFNVQRAMSPVELLSFEKLLSVLPRVPLKHLRCVIRCAVRAVGVSMRTCGNDGHTSDCFGIRVLEIPCDGLPPAGYSRVVIRGVGYAIPSGKTATVEGSEGKSTLVGPIPKGCKSRCLPQVRNHHEDDGPAEYFPEIGRNVNHAGSGDILDRACANPADHRGGRSAPKARVPKSGKRARSNRKGQAAGRTT